MNKLMQEAQRIQREKDDEISKEQHHAMNEIKVFLNRSPNNALSLSVKQHLEKSYERGKNV